jgi:hypothetical protein
MIKHWRNNLPLYPSGKFTTLPFNFLPRKYAVLLLPSALTSGVQCLVVALTGPLCWIRQGSTLTAQLGVVLSDFLMASMIRLVSKYCLSLVQKGVLMRYVQVIFGIEMPFAISSDAFSCVARVLPL